jgi:single-strand DNA-binding protein
MASRSLNKALLIGNLTRDPELKYTPKGNAVCTFSVATNSTWKDSDGNVQEVAEFHNIVTWNKLAEICSQILKMGTKVYIEGEIRTRKWEKDGVQRTRTEIRADDMKILSPLSKNVELGMDEGKDGESVHTKDDDSKAPKTVGEESEIDSIDDLPF